MIPSGIKRYQQDEVLPINWRTLPYWLVSTVRNHQSIAVPAKPQQSWRRYPSLLRPNLKAPVFALGAPRSGTTFLGECLSVLPEISYHFEPVVTKAAVRPIYEGDWGQFKAALLYRSVYSWLMRMRNEANLRFCEKTPGNCFIVPFLQQTFEQAQFIHIVRDGRDSAISLAEKPWYSNASKGTQQRDPDGYFFGPGRRFFVEPNRVDEYESTDDFHRCLWLWRCYVEQALQGTQALPKANLLEIRYEELVTNPETVSEHILDFLNIEPSASRTVFKNYIVERANPGSLQRWKTTLNHSQLAAAEQEAGGLLQQLGYERPGATVG